MRTPKFINDGPWIRFELEGCDDFIDRAIGETCSLYGLPDTVASLRGGSAWESVEIIDQACKDGGIKLALNDTTIVGNAIKDGDKRCFWQKMMPILFEHIVGERWEFLKKGDGIVADYYLGDKIVDCKCKHRNVRPNRNHNIPKNKKLIATVPTSQWNLPVDYYCFGQMANRCTHGYILGVMSKEDFQEESSRKEVGEVDSNGERYALPVDAVYLDRLFHWHSSTFDSFLPLKYLV